MPSGTSTYSGNVLHISGGRTVVGDTITQHELDELPIINRDPLNLVFLLGGVTEAPLSTGDSTATLVGLNSSSGNWSA